MILFILFLYNGKCRALSSYINAYTKFCTQVFSKKFKLDNADIITSKHEMEFKSAKYKFNLGFIEPINMTPEMFYEG